MKLIEFGHYDMASNDSEIKDILLEAIKFVPQTISVFPNNLRIAKSLIQENRTETHPIHRNFHSR